MELESADLERLKIDKKTNRTTIMVNYPYFEIPVDTAVESKYSKNACYEFGKKYFELKKSIYIPERFNIIYKECIDAAKVKCDTNDTLPKLYIDKRMLYLPYHFEEFTYELSGGTLYSSSLYHNISIVFPSSFMIMNSSAGSLIAIPYSWREFLLCDPTASKAICGSCKKIVGYIESNYNNLQFECLHMLR